MTERSLIVIFCMLFAIGSAFLFWQNERGLDPNLNKNWWTVSFAEPQDRTSLAFTIDNHSQATSFRYQISTGKTILRDATVTVERGSSFTISPDVTGSASTRTTVTVMTDSEKKEIYR